MSLHHALERLIKYLGVGIFNTFIGFGLIFLLTFLAILPEIANLIGYLAGFVVSYLLNKFFTFKSTNSHKRDLLKFSICMGVAYIANLIALSISYRIFLLDPYISQIIGGGVYTIVGFAMSYLWGFRQIDETPK